MLLGTRLIYCISDILDGTVKKSDVFAIITTDTFDLSNEGDIEYWLDTAVLLSPVTQDPRNKLSNYSRHDVLCLFSDLVAAGLIVNRQHAIGHSLLDLELASMRKHWYSINLIPEDMDPIVHEAWEYFKSAEALCKK